MLKPIQYWVLLALAAVSVLLVVSNIGLYFSNRSAQAQISARAQYLQQSQAIGTLYEDIAKALANLAVEHRDEEVRAMLAQEGFTINAAPVKATESANATAAPTRTGR